MARFVVVLEDQVTRGATSASQSTGNLQDQLEGLNGSTGSASEGMGSLEEVLAAAPEMIAAAAAAVVALAAAALYAGSALSVSAGESRQALLALASAETGSAAAGNKVVSMIDELAQKLPIAKDKLAAYAKGFMSAGIRDVPALQKALEATAAASALMGDEGGAAFSELLKKATLAGEAGKNFKNFSKSLRDVGLDVNDVAAQLGVPAKKLEGMLKSGKVSAAQLGDALENAMSKKGANAIEVANNRLSVMVDKAKAWLVGLFDEVVETQGYKDFLAALRQVGQVIQSLAGNGKSSMTSLFGAVFGLTAKVITYTLIGLLKIATWGIKAYIWLFPFLQKLKEWEQKLGFIDKFVTVLKTLGTVVGIVLVPVFMAFAEILAVMVGLVVVVYQALGWVIKGIGAVATKVWGFVKDTAKALKSWVDGAVQAAKDFVAGLTDGLAEGVPGVSAATSKLGNVATESLKKSLKISSPSKVTMELGDYTAQGFALGLTNASNDVTAAAGGVADAAVGGVSSPSKGAAASSGPSITVNVQAGAVVINGGAGGAAELTREAVALLFEEVALAMGRGSAAA